MPVKQIIGGAIDYRVQNKLAEKAFQRNKDFYWETWNATNAYNSPVQTIARMKEAGLNPALMYGGSGGGPGGSTTQGNVPQRESPQWAKNSALDYAQMQLMQKQGDETESNTVLNNSNSALSAERVATEKKRQLQIDYQNAKTDAEKDSIRQRLKYADQLSEMSLEFQMQQIANLRAQELKTTAEYERLDQTKMYYIAQEKKKLEVMNSQIDLNKALTDQAKAEEAIKRIDSIIKGVKADLANQGVDTSSLPAILASTTNSFYQKAEKLFRKWTNLDPKRLMSDDVLEMYNNWRTKK